MPKTTYILIIDDNEKSQDVLKQHLRQKGYQCAEAEGEAEALRMIEAQSFDLILLDIMMPHISGLDILLAIRKKHTMIELPIIILTASHQVDDMVTALNMGANDYIIKPIDFLIAMARIQTQISRKKLDQELKESEAYLRDLFDNTSDMIQSMSPDGYFLFVNRSWQTKLGYTQEEALTLRLLDIIHPEQQSYYIKLFKKLKQGHTINITETIFVSKSKRELIVEGTLSCKINKGKLIFIRGIFRDITERRRVENMKDEFVSMVSHELRTPLTSINGALRLLIGGVAGELPEQARKLLDVATNNCDRLVRLINDILDIEKIEFGHMDFNFRPIELSSLIRQSIQDNASYAEQYRVDFKFNNKAHFSEVWVKGDPDRLTQVMTNLLSNAVKYSPAQESVIVTLQNERNIVRVSVANKGQGIPEKFQKHIFQKFSQADSSSTRLKGGTGLGLSISKAIIKKHGGTIGFKSKPDQGTIFYFNLSEYPKGKDQ